MKDTKELDIEINQNTRLSRIFEIFPGLFSWFFLSLPILLSLTNPVWLAYLIIAYDLLWLVKSLGLSHRLIKGYRRLKRYKNVNWASRLNDLSDIDSAIKRMQTRINRQKGTSLSKEYLEYLQTLRSNKDFKNPDNVYNAVIIATYNESLDTLEPTVKSLLNTDYSLKKMFLYIAYEERGGESTKNNAEYLINKYGKRFAHAEAVEHPAEILGELKAKGGNITYCAKKLSSYVSELDISADDVIVTTLDSDNRPATNYFSYLTFLYCTTTDRIKKSYQPIPMFYNNIWDVPAPMRVIATGNTFWQLMEMMRPHRLRNFSAHAQSLQTLHDTNYWSVKTIVEDGHQYWRTYFTYDGDHQVIPVYTAVYQDAVLAKGYIKTFKAQFVQLRRWAWGASDMAYFITHAYGNRRINFSNKFVQFFRLFEGHFSWATAPLILAFAAWAPLVLNSNFNELVLAHQLPIIASRIQMVTTFGILINLFVSLKSLPPRPVNHKRGRSLMMVFQWSLLPFTTIVFGSFAALNAQTRLMFKKYLLKFDVTEKAVKKW
jgi:hypothetical protein